MRAMESSKLVIENSSVWYWLYRLFTASFSNRSVFVIEFKELCTKAVVKLSDAVDEEL